MSLVLLGTNLALAVLVHFYRATTYSVVFALTAKQAGNFGTEETSGKEMGALQSSTCAEHAPKGAPGECPRWTLKAQPERSGSAARGMLVCQILPPSEIIWGLCLAVFATRKGSTCSTELAESVEYGNFGMVVMFVGTIWVRLPFAACRKQRSTRVPYPSNAITV